MKKHIIGATLASLLALPVLAQNIAIVNGKAIPCLLYTSPSPRD